VYQTTRARDFDAATSLKMFMPHVLLNQFRFLLVVSLLSLSVDLARAASITLNPMQDTYISEAFTTPNGTITEMVIGTQGSTAGNAKNRGLIQFDLSSLPPGAVVSSVILRLTVTRVPSTPINSNFHLHRLLQPWDDLESIWTLRLEPDENWTIPGGQEGTDFATTVSSSVPVAGVGGYVFASTPELVADVTAWLTNSTANHGWLVKAENESVGFTARRFASFEGLSGAPVLEIQFEASEPLRIKLATIVADQICFSFTAKAGKTYTLERREHVDSGQWTIVATLPAPDITAEALLCDALVSTGSRFYRVGEQ
jgi:hypothetical protein